MLRRIVGAVSVPTVGFWQARNFCAHAEERKMPMVMMGGTGLVVSKLSFGFWGTFGTKQDCDNCAKIMQMARDSGVNLFDNAEVYGKNRGDAEIIMGTTLKWLQSEENPKHDMWKRSKIILTTKIFWGGDDINEKGLSRKHIIEGMDASLERMQVDYVDIVFAHRADMLGNMEETVRAFTHLIRTGKAFYWGTSEWSAQEITEAYWIAKVHGLIPPVVEQPQYNLFERERVEKEYRRLYEGPYRMGTTIWSPLSSGVLTGKYNKQIPKGSRFDTEGYGWLAKEFAKEKAEKIPKVEGLMKIADRIGCSVAQLSLAWCMKNPNVSTVLLGSTKFHQLEENLAAIDAYDKLTPEVMAEIDEVMQNTPKKEAHYGRSLL